MPMRRHLFGFISSKDSRFFDEITMITNSKYAKHCETDIGKMKPAQFFARKSHPMLAKLGFKCIPEIFPVQI